MLMHSGQITPLGATPGQNRVGKDATWKLERRRKSESTALTGPWVFESAPRMADHLWLAGGLMGRRSADRPTGSNT